MGHRYAHTVVYHTFKAIPTVSISKWDEEVLHIIYSGVISPEKDAMKVTCTSKPLAFYSSFCGSKDASKDIQVCGSESLSRTDEHSEFIDAASTKES